MASAPPTGEAAPSDGALPASALAGIGGRALSAYVHVPFCAVRCGYCDFNTYVAGQLGGFGVADYLGAVHQEIALARRVLPTEAPPLGTVFFGGGTPSLLTGEQLAGILADLSGTFGLAPDAEVTTEANPESVDAAWCDAVLAAGVNRLSLGMQSARPHVLATLDRVHTPGQALRVAELARSRGFDQISLDLIYGTPGETLADWRASIEAALSVRPDHISAYALIVEDGTAMARRMRSGQLAWPDDDEAADKYLLAEELFTAAGLTNYEISNWSTAPATRARHNLAYWRSTDWWGFGPGAHSHVGGVRWWNRRHPRDWAAELRQGRSPAAARELLDADQRHTERVLLELRIADGLPLDELHPSEAARVPELVDRGLIEVRDAHLHLTLTGRLLADAVTRDLLD